MDTTKQVSEAESSAQAAEPSHEPALASQQEASQERPNEPVPTLSATEQPTGAPRETQETSQEKSGPSSQEPAPSALPDSLAELSLCDRVESSARDVEQSTEPQALEARRESSAEDMSEHWPIKWIQWPPELQPDQFPEARPIIMQRHNGPCSFIALCNILLLRSDIALPPQYETAVPFDILAGLVADHILTGTQDAPHQVEDLFQTIPKTRVGLEVNPRFGSIYDFDVPSDRAAEVNLFAQAKVHIIHGWLAESQDALSHAALVDRSGSYDQATVRLAQADDLVNGLVLSTEASYQDLLVMAQPQEPQFSSEQKELLQDGCLIRDFLSTTQSQLSHEGLFAFISSLQPGSLTALFRANHVSVLYRVKRNKAPLLYTLVTDSAFLHAPNHKTIWESLETVEGNNTFVRADLSPIRDAAIEASVQADRHLAQQLQAEQDAFPAQPAPAPQGANTQPVAPAQQQPTPGPSPAERPKEVKKKRSCCIS